LTRLRTRLPDKTEVREEAEVVIDPEATAETGEVAAEKAEVEIETPGPEATAEVRGEAEEATDPPQRRRLPNDPTI
jgi:hypothetical protein